MLRPMNVRLLALAGMACLRGTAVEAGVPAIDAALAAHYKDGPPSGYTYAMTDLNGDGVPDAVVLITDPQWCGSGGCALAILRGKGKGFVFLSGASISREPIPVLAETRKGWRSLSVTVAGGGATSGDVVLRFTGHRYPGNPSVQPRATAPDLAGALTLTFSP